MYERRIIRQRGTAHLSCASMNTPICVSNAVEISLIGFAGDMSDVALFNISDNFEDAIKR